MPNPQERKKNLATRPLRHLEKLSVERNQYYHTVHKKAVAMKLAKSEGITVAKTMCIQQRPNCIPAETAQMVADFFCLDSISWHAPGKQDFVTERKDGKKEQVQKWHLLLSLQETIICSVEGREFFCKNWFQQVLCFAASKCSASGTIPTSSLHVCLS